MQRCALGTAQLSCYFFPYFSFDLVSIRHQKPSYQTPSQPMPMTPTGQTKVASFGPPKIASFTTLQSELMDEERDGLLPDGSEAGWSCSSS